jgi:hypothetical protein
MTQVEIRVAGHLDQGWADWLDGFTITHTKNNETILTGTLDDQAALYGIMAKLRDLGLKLNSVHYSELPLVDHQKSYGA